MGRAASMYSLFYHVDEGGRHVGMQRFKSNEWDCVIVIDVDLLVKNVEMEHVFINPTGTVSISVPVARQTFDRIVVPKQGNKTDDYVVYD
eukprot:4675953-Lingulodinium_polyedra.AAC.1